MDKSGKWWAQWGMMTILLVEIFLIGFVSGMIAKQYISPDSHFLPFTGFTGFSGGATCEGPPGDANWIISDNCNISGNDSLDINGYDFIINNGATVNIVDCTINFTPATHGADTLSIAGNAVVTISGSTIQSDNTNRFRIHTEDGTSLSMDNTNISYLHVLSVGGDIDSFGGNRITDSLICMWLNDTADNIDVEDFYCEGSYLGTMICGADFITFDNYNFTGAGTALFTQSAGISPCIGNLEGITINNSNLVSNDRKVIDMFSGPDDFTIVNSYIEKTEGDGEVGGGDAESFAGLPTFDDLLICRGDCDNIIIENNKFKKPSSGTDLGFSIYVDGDNARIVGNSINASKRGGIQLIGSTGSLIANNTINKTTSLFGIVLNASTSNEIIGNTIVGNQNRVCPGGVPTRAAISFKVNSNNNIMADNTIITSSNGVAFNDGNNNVFKDGTLDADCTGTVYDVSFGGAGDNFLINTTLAHDTFNITGAGKIHVQWYTDVYVNDGSNPISGASVNVTNGSDVMIYQSTTNGAGLVRKLNITERMVTSGGETYPGNYTINASAAGYVDNDTELNMSDVAANVQVNLALGAISPYHYLNVSLVSPTHLSSHAEGMIDYNYTATSDDPINNCSLRLSNPGGYRKTDYDVTSGQVENITWDENASQQIWRVDCYTDFNYTISEAWSLEILEAARIYLMTPEDGNTNDSYTITFEYNVTSDLELANCSLIIDDTKVDIENNIRRKNATSGGINNFTYVFPSDGDYTWRVNCTNSAGTESTSGERDITIAAYHSIDVSLVSPPNLGAMNITNDTSIDFNFTVNSLDSVNNCTLYLSYALVYNPVQTSIGIVNNQTNTLAYPISNSGVYDWFINCSTDYAWNVSGIWGLDILVNPFIPKPVVTLISPTDDSTSTSYSVTFRYNVTHPTAERGIANCSLLVGESIVTTDDSITKDVEQTLSHTFSSNGDYDWAVKCTDEVNEFDVSETRSITISVSNPNPSPSPSPGPSTPSGTTYTAKLNLTPPETILVFPGLEALDRVKLEVMYPDFTRINYTIKADELVENSHVTLSIDFENPFDLYKKWAKTVDLNGNGAEDIFFRLNSMPDGSKANLSIGNLIDYEEGDALPDETPSGEVKIRVIAPPPDIIKKEPKVELEKKPNYLPWSIAFFALVVVIAVLLLIHKHQIHLGNKKPPKSDTSNGIVSLTPPEKPETTSKKAKK
ncbi:MAG: right-handed parallel beta-helix repeat-containing protein [archaeon]